MADQKDDRETDDAYPGIVTHLSSDLRVIVCKYRIQWIAQRLAGSRWRSFRYCTTRNGLIRLETRFLLRCEVEERPARIPDDLGRVA